MQLILLEKREVISLILPLTLQTFERYEQSVDLASSRNHLELRDLECQTAGNAFRHAIFDAVPLISQYEL